MKVLKGIACKYEGVVAEFHSESEFGFLRNSQASSAVTLHSAVSPQ